MSERGKAIGALLHSVAMGVAFVVTVFLLYFVKIPTDQREYALILLGALIGEIRGVGSYWTGSTASSQTKDATIATIATANAPPPTKV